MFELGAEANIEIIVPVTIPRRKNELAGPDHPSGLFMRNGGTMERPEDIVVVNFTTQPGFLRWGRLLRTTFRPRDNSELNSLLEAIDEAVRTAPSGNEGR